MLIYFITRSNCALDRRTVFCLYVHGFQRQICNYVRTIHEIEGTKKINGSVFVAKSAYNSQINKIVLHRPVIEEDMYTKRLHCTKQPKGT